MRITRTRSPERYFPLVLREMSDGRRNQWKAVNQAILKHAADFIEELAHVAAVPKYWRWSMDTELFEDSFTTVYLHFDSENRLVYVGETQRGLARQLEHKRNKAWYREIVITRLVHVPNKEAARDLEKLFIKTLRPIMNIALNNEVLVIEAEDQSRLACDIEEASLITREQILEAKAKADEDPETFVAFMDKANLGGSLLASEARMVERYRRQVNADIKDRANAA